MGFWDKERVDVDIVGSCSGGLGRAGILRFRWKLSYGFAVLTRYCVRQGNIRFARSTVGRRPFHIGFRALFSFWPQRNRKDQNIHSGGRKSFIKGGEIFQNSTQVGFVFLPFIVYHQWIDEEIFFNHCHDHSRFLHSCDDHRRFLQRGGGGVVLSEAWGGCKQWSDHSLPLPVHQYEQDGWWTINIRHPRFWNFGEYWQDILMSFFLLFAMLSCCSNLQNL